MKRSKEDAAKKSVGSGAKYSRLEVLALKECFDAFDTDGNGSISVKEVLEYSQEQAKKGAKADPRLPYDVHLFVRVLDVNKDGRVTFDEVVQNMYPLANARDMKIMLGWVAPDKPPALDTHTVPPDMREELEAMFKLYDKNGDGSLDRKELQAVAESAGYSPSEFDDLFKLADKDNDERICLEEFLQLMRTAWID